MNKSKIVKIAFILLTIIVVSACNLPCNIGVYTTGNQNSGTESPAITVPGSKEQVNPNPVGIQEGLGSLDSYKMTLYMNSHNSKGNKSEVTETIERSVVDKSSHSVTTQVSYDPANDTGESTSTSETYEVGNATCMGSGESWTYSEMSAQDKEMADVFKGMMDILPKIEDPKFVGAENVNGIDTNHFSFQVKGIGDSSGSVATVNSGDYWLAMDGQYIVKYHLVLAVQSAATGTENAETSNIEASIDLTNINQPVSFTMPPTCVPSTDQ